MDHIRILLKCKVLESMWYCNYTVLDNQLGKFKEHLSRVKRSSTFPYNSGNLKNLRLISIMEWRGGCWNHALHRKAGMQITKLMEYPVTRKYGKGWIWQSCQFFVSFVAGKILRAGVDPGFFLRGGVPLRNGITKNIDTKKKTFD